MESILSARLELAVCMLDSIHSTSWLTQLAGKGINFLHFPVSPKLKVFPSLKNSCLVLVQRASK
jgi:hypothetical protein